MRNGNKSKTNYALDLSLLSADFCSMKSGKTVSDLYWILKNSLRKKKDFNKLFYLKYSS